MADLAAKLSLDKSSVSLALRGSPKVSEATRKRVLATARKLGYVPNLAARQLSTASAHLIGLALPGDFHALAHSVVIQAIQNLAESASSTGLLFSIYLSEHLARFASREESFAHVPDGLCVWGDTSVEQVRSIERLRRPVVVLDPSDPSYEDFTSDAVRIDNAGGGTLVAEHLLSRGAKRLLVVQELDRHTGHVQRHRSARAAWLRSRPASSLRHCLLEDLTDDALRSFCAKSAGAIMCTNDRCALTVWHRLQRLGIDVPTGVKLTGFDGEESGRQIGLTTARPDWDAFARLGFDTLVARIARKRIPGADLTASVALVEGATT